ncbi:MAG: Gfo/Idh/MocA family protein, partial [Fusobacteriaceae bacterium]
MIRFGVIGTNAITERFLEAAFLCPEFQLNSIYSRALETGKAFGDKYGVVNIYTDIDEMIMSKNIDAVYIASPTSFHFLQAKKFLEKKIPVLCEKPLASNSKEVKELIELSKKHNTLFMEAIRTVHNPNFNVIKENLQKIGTIRGVYANFCQYSSRYDKFKEGIVLNAFKPEFSNGSTMDIGLYTFYFVIGLFGEPLNCKSSGIMLSSGVDGAGTSILQYSDFVATVNHSKISNSYIPSEIVGEKGSIIIENISLLEKITLKLKDGTEKEITIPRVENDMYYEIQEFIKTITEKNIESAENPHNISLKVSKVMEMSRKE